MTGNQRWLPRFLADGSGFSSIEFALVSAAVGIVLSAALLAFSIKMETMTADRGPNGDYDAIITGSTGADPYADIRTACPSVNQAPYLRWKDLVAERCSERLRERGWEQPFPPR